jgi:hypothetical protein
MSSEVRLNVESQIDQELKKHAGHPKAFGPCTANDWSALDNHAEESHRSKGKVGLYIAGFVEAGDRNPEDNPPDGKSEHPDSAPIDTRWWAVMTESQVSGGLTDKSKYDDILKWMSRNPNDKAVNPLYVDKSRSKQDQKDSLYNHDFLTNIWFNYYNKKFLKAGTPHVINFVEGVVDAKKSKDNQSEMPYPDLAGIQLVCADNGYCLFKDADIPANEDLYILVEGGDGNRVDGISNWSGIWDDTLSAFKIPKNVIEQMRQKKITVGFPQFDERGRLVYVFYLRIGQTDEKLCELKAASQPTTAPGKP